MIQDALLILWDCSQTSDSATDKFEYDDAGDAEIYKRIKDVAKSHHKIQTFIENTGFRGRKALSTTAKGNAKLFGLYTQALSEGLTEVIQSYKKALVEVEGLVIGNHNYTLSFVYSYVEKFHGLFNILNKIIRTIEERKLIGCQIISIIHQYILNSNERVHEAIVIIFSCINKVFINQLCTWLLYGELRDPYQEFIIQRNQGDESSDTILSIPSTNNTCDRSLVTTLQDNTLECGYTLNPNMIPYFMPLSLAQEILFIGKTIILFGFDPKKVKKSHSSVSRTLMPLQKCNIGMDTRRFTIWEDKEAEFHDKLQKLKSPEVFEVCNLRSVIREIKECVTKHLWTVAVEEAELLHELKLMKDFYLLGRGELFLELLRLTAPMLDKPTTRTSTRDMNHAFQLAARAMLLGNSADIEKFSFEQPYVKPNLSTNSPIEDDINTDGWSSIILKYDFKWPLHLLFTPEVLARYNDMFRLLLRMKKTQHDLHALWKTYKQASSFSMRQLHNKLMFLMDNLQHYMQADVLETNFSRLMDTFNKTNDFEKLKKAHANFLADILSQSFLTITSSAESDCSGDTMDSINNPVFCNIMELIQLCNSFCGINEIASDKDKISYYLSSYSERFNKLVKQLMQLLVSLRDRPCGVYLARLLMRLDYNRWLSKEAQLTQSVTNMLRY